MKTAFVVILNPFTVRVIFIFLHCNFLGFCGFLFLCVSTILIVYHCIINVWSIEVLIVVILKLLVGNFGESV